MRSGVLFGLIALALVPGAGLAQADTRPGLVSAFLCDTSAHAMQFADLRDKGETEEFAKDRVGRMATADVCGRYVGIAKIQSESVFLKGGVAYKLTAFVFQEDQKVAWLAERSFAPPNAAAWDL